jgi:hypothetical protein
MANLDEDRLKALVDRCAKAAAMFKGKHSHELVLVVQEHADGHLRTTGPTSPHKASSRPAVVADLEARVRSLGPGERVILVIALDGTEYPVTAPRGEEDREGKG